MNRERQKRGFVFTALRKVRRRNLINNQKNLRHRLFTDASAKKKYLEILVAKNAKGYTKGSRIKFEKFQPYIDNAVEQAKMYCEEPKKVAGELGTAVGKLIEKMRL